MPTCPYCNQEIDKEINMYDWNNYDEYVFLYYSGVCFKCHRSYKWEETYKRIGEFDYLEEIKELD